MDRYQFCNNTGKSMAGKIHWADTCANSALVGEWSNLEIINYPIRYDACNLAGSKFCRAVEGRSTLNSWIRYIIHPSTIRVS